MANPLNLASNADARQAADGTMYVFAYGSLLSPALMTQICPSARFNARAFLPNYEVQFRVPSDTGQGGISGIVEAPGLLTGGVIYEVATAHVARLDTLEGVDDGLYRRDPFLVLGEDRKWFQVELYRPAELPEAQIDPAPFYLDHMIQGATVHGMDPDFVARLQDWRNSLE